MRPGKIGEIKQVVRTPASWNAFIAASRRSMLTALSISARKSSSSVFDFWPKFNVYELSPGLRVIGKTLHKRCVAIFAAVATAHIRIDRIITHRQIGFCEDAFYFNVSDDWLHCMYAPLILLIFHGTVSSYPSYRQNRLFDTAACLCLRFQDKFLKYAADEPALQAT